MNLGKTSGLTAAALLALTALGPHFDSQGVYRYPYGSATPPTLQCSPDRVCELVLETGEVIYDKVAGDTERWIIASGVAGDRGDTPAIFFKPSELGTRSNPMETNLILTTSKRTYEVRLVAARHAAHTRYGFYFANDSLEVSGASVPSSVPSPSAQDGPQPSTGEPDAVPPQLYDFSYRIEGDTDYRPIVVWNDGRHTYLKLRPDSQAPSIYTRLANGQLAMVNYHPPINNVYAIDGTPNHLVLIGTVGRHVPRVEIIREQ